MREDWGEIDGNQFVTFVFRNEPVIRLRGIGKRVHHALA